MFGTQCGVKQELCNVLGSPDHYVLPSSSAHSFWSGSHTYQLGSLGRYWKLQVLGYSLWLQTKLWASKGFVGCLLRVCLKFPRHELCLSTVLRVRSLCCLTLEQFKRSPSCNEDGGTQWQGLLSVCHAADYAEWPEKHVLSLASRSEIDLGELHGLGELNGLQRFHPVRVWIARGSELDPWNTSF